MNDLDKKHTSMEVYIEQLINQDRQHSAQAQALLLVAAELQGIRNVLETYAELFLQMQSPK